MKPVSLIKTKELSFAYDQADGKLALQNLDLEVSAGSYVALIGANGSGKSTLARLFNALLKPTSGSVEVAGFDTGDFEHLFDIRRAAGMVFQNPDTQMVTNIVVDEVAFGPENIGLCHEQIVQAVDGAIAAVAMTQHRDANPAKLSGGQKQRVCIAGVLAMAPNILILDEPAAQLDPRGQRGIRRIIKELHAQGMTVIHVTHSMEEAMRAERVLVMCNGRIVAQGEPRDVLCDAAHLKTVGLRPPFSVRLAAALRERGVNVSPAVDPSSLAKEIAGLFEDAPAPSMSEPSTPSIRRKPPAQPSIACEHISYTYRSQGRQTKALDSVSFTVEQGAFCGIAGHTGSGKSTLLALLSALTKPSAGKIAICDLDLAKRKDRRMLHTKVGLALQYPEQQLFAPTVAQDVAYGLINAGVAKAELAQRVRVALQAMGLDFDRYAQRNPLELSGGEQRRVALAGVLATEPQVLLLDEPTAGLDPRGCQEVLSYIKTINASGVTVVMVSHNMDDLAELCTQIVVLKDGCVVLNDTPTKVFDPQVNRQTLKDLNLELPHTVSFAELLQSKISDSEVCDFDIPLSIGELADAIAAKLKVGGELNGN